MKRKAIRGCSVILACGAAGLALAVPASMAKKHHHPLPHVKITLWTATTAAGTASPVAPGATITHCTSDPEHSLDVSGRVKHAASGKHFTVQFLLNGQVRDAFHEHWVSNGPGKFGDGITNDAGLPDGLWGLKIVEAGKTIGQSSVTIAANPAC